MAALLRTVTEARFRVQTQGREDPVTRMLKRGSAVPAEQDLLDVARAVAITPQSTEAKAPWYGEIYAGLRAQRIKEAEALAHAEIAQENLDIERDRLIVDVAGKLVTQRGQIGQAVNQWLDMFKGTVPPEVFKQIAMKSITALISRPVSTPEQAWHAMAESISGMALPPGIEKTSDERFLSEYTGLRTKLRAGIPLTPEEQDRLDWIGGYRFTKVTPGTVGPQIVQPPMQPIQGQPSAAPSPISGEGKRVETTIIPGGPKVTRTEMEPTKALPKDAQEDLEAVARSLHSIDTLRRNIKYTGLISGNIERGKIKIGAGEPGAIAFDTAVKNFRVDAQSLIKGIPSNFDVETFIETLPALGLPENVNRARIEWHARSTHLLLALKVGYFKHLGYQIPPQLLEIARSYGVNPDDIRALSKEEVLAKTGQMKDDAIKNTAEETRTIGGKTYYRVGGKWHD